jgi:hypothetical protein
MDSEKIRRGWQLGLGLLLAGGLAWSGLLDQASAAYVDGALLGTGAIYATARGINALVSVLQGTELDLAVLTLSVGELLDPINDLIERFSAILLFALGSLALQKILLELVSHTSFNLLLTASALATLAALYWGNGASYRALLRLFVVTVVLRFSLALVRVLCACLQSSGSDGHWLAMSSNGRHFG